MNDTNTDDDRMQLDPMSIESIPNEIIEHHIFKYWKYNNWVVLLRTVCKRWMWIVENSKRTEKHLILTGNDPDIGISIYLIKKFQPTIVTLRELIESRFALGLMLAACKNLTGLILLNPELIMRVQKTHPMNSIEQIDTLVITTEALDTTLMDLFLLIFPNLTRFHWIEKPSRKNLETNYKKIRRHYKNVKTLITKDYSYVEERKPRKFANMSGLTYEEYFRRFGQTKFLTYLSYELYEDAAYILNSESSMAYEMQLNLDLEYKFPTHVGRRWNMDSYEYFISIFSCVPEIAYDLFVDTDLIPMMKTHVKFNTYVGFQWYDEALKVLENAPESEGRENYSSSCLIKLFKVTPIQQLKHKNVHRILKKEMFGHRRFLEIDSVETLEKVSLFINDWERESASLEDPTVFLAMVNKGCRIPSSSLLELAETRDEWRSIAEEMLKFGSDRFDVFNESPLERDFAIKWLQYFNLTPLIEKNGTSLLNRWIEGCMLKKEITKYLDLIDHMDSNGCTPLLASIRKLSPGYELRWKQLNTLLMLGADPNKHRSDLPSPLAALVILEFKNDRGKEEEERVKKEHYTLVIDTTNLLLEYGADLNAPCQFEQRMCTPLMIAVKLKRPLSLIRALVALGARIDYADDLGKSILYYADTDSRNELLGLKSVYN